MNTFNYILSTGHETISGSQYEYLSRNRETNLVNPLSLSSIPLVFNLTSSGQIKTDSFSLDEEYITGSHVSLLNFNSQTLLEGDEEINSSQRWNYYTLDSGDYFVDIDSGGSVFHFNSGLNLTSNDSVSYDQRDFGTGIMVYKSSSSESISLTFYNLYNKVNDAYSNAGSSSEYESNYYTFLNGQKVISSSFPSSSVTGKMFAIPKRESTVEIYSTDADIFGSGYIDYQIDFYLNGMRQSVSDVIQLYTGVYIIESGVQCSLGEYNLENSNTYNL